MTPRKTDILIVGGGAAGIAAAYEASTTCNVIIIDVNPYLGGNATASEVGTICGLYTYTQDGESEYLVSGFAEKFSQLLKSKSNSTAIKNRERLQFLPYKKEAFINLSNSLLSTKNVDVLVNTKITDAKIDNGYISQVTIKSGNKELEIYPKAVIDCSGISIVSQLLDLKLQPFNTSQSPAIVFVLDNIAAENEFAIKIHISKTLNTLTESDSLYKEFKSAHLIPGSLGNGKASFKIGIQNNDKNPASLKATSQVIVNKFHEFLKQNSSIFKSSTLLRIADLVGIRSGMRPLGKYTLTEKDVLNCRKFENAIAKSAWPIEEWKDDLQVHLTPLPFNNWYEIPASCLESIEIENLFFAGKNISATDKAIASARVIGTCLQTGEAAGKLAVQKITKIQQDVYLRSEIEEI